MSCSTSSISFSWTEDLQLVRVSRCLNIYESTPNVVFYSFFLWDGWSRSFNIHVRIKSKLLHLVYRAMHSRLLSAAHHRLSPTLAELNIINVWNDLHCCMSVSLHYCPISLSVPFTLPYGILLLFIFNTRLQHHLPWNGSPVLVTPHAWISCPFPELPHHPYPFLSLALSVHHSKLCGFLTTLIHSLLHWYKYLFNNFAQ